MTKKFIMTAIERKNKEFINKLNSENLKLNVCSGLDYRENFVNLDIGDKDIYDHAIKVDVIHDITKSPYPFKDKAFSYIYMHNSLEHFEKDMVPKIVKELCRITRSGGVVNIIVPYFTNYVNPRDLTHKSLFVYETFQTSCMNEYVQSVDTKLILTNNKFFKFLNRIINLNKKLIKIYERFFCYMIVAQELNVKIKVK